LGPGDSSEEEDFLQLSPSLFVTATFSKKDI